MSDAPRSDSAAAGPGAAAVPPAGAARGEPGAERPAAPYGAAYPGYASYPGYGSQGGQGNYGYGAGYGGGYAGYGQASERTLTATTIRGYLAILRRRWWTVVAVFAVFVTVGLVQAFRAPRVYSTRAKLVVERNAPGIANVGGLMETQPWWDPDYYRTQLELIGSRAVLEVAAQDPALRPLFRPAPAAGAAPRRSLLGELRGTVVALLGGTPSGPPEPWQVLRGLIDARQISGSHVIVLESSGGDPQRIADVVNTVARAFQRYHVSRKVEFHGEAYRFLQEQQAAEEKALRDAEAALQKFRETSTTVGITTAEQDQPVLKRLDELNKEITAAQLQRITLAAQINVVRDIHKGVRVADSNTLARLMSAPGIADESNVLKVQEQLAAAEKRVAELSRQYGKDHPLLRAAREDVVSLRRALEQSLERAVLSMANRVRAVEDKEAELAVEIDKQKAQALHLARDLVEYNRLKNEVERHGKLFDMLVERLREVDVSSRFVRTDVQIAEPAAVPKAPQNPGAHAGSCGRSCSGSSPASASRSSSRTSTTP